MRNILIFVGLVLFAGVWIGYFALAKRSQEKQETHESPETGAVSLTAEAIADQMNKPPPGTALPILWSAPEFSYTDQNGKVLSTKDLLGHVWISDFFFSNCNTICPMMTAKMSQLQKTIPNPHIEFVSFSVDPDHDTPQVLKEYARMWKADDRWHFLSTDAENLAKTAAAMKTFVRPPGKDAPVQHSTIFILTDDHGNVRGVYDSSDPPAMQRLTIDALTLAGTPPPADSIAAAPAWTLPSGRTTGASPGEKLFVWRGCVACHTQGRIAPPITGCYGRAVALDDGTTTMADEAYLRESILDPNAKVVAGYPRLMPSYRGQLTEHELEQIVDYIKSLSDHSAGELLAASQPAATQSAGILDSVCKMHVDPKDGATLHTMFAGHTYYFCSTTCRDRFLKSPSSYDAKLASATAPATQP